ncbi:hypothetical protein QTP70_024267 [Hemibagrus guttatus]|uniref:Venom protein n=1 Tax=Hemibagrus guttatus TaxID=175788 RepID=A0AAE0QNC1_9TELE|nr:hypothetical protein QTP70_024267 [Hemibagrus guttatus]
MKIFLLFLLTAMVVTAAPYLSKSDESKLQHVILEEIIQSTKDLKDLLKADLFVQKVIISEDCTRPNFCKAGKILGMYRAEELGLKQTDWLLPRKLVAYTRDCVVTTKSTSIIKFADDAVVMGRITDNDETAYLEKIRHLENWS